MNNDTNSNLNGTVLGNVDNTNLNPNPIPTETVESLDNVVPENLNNGQVVNNMMAQPQQQSELVQTEQSAQNTFFNNPPVNDINTGSLNEGPQIQSTVIEPVQQVEPTPAYTNPQTINPAPMPGFESSDTIGTQPPISLEPEKQPKKKTNKVLFIIIILILLAGVGFGTYYVLNYTDLLSKAEQISIVTNDLEINMGDPLSTNISDYATITGTDSKNCSLNTMDVDNKKEGTYEFKITCGETIKTGTIKVVDNSVLEVETQKVYKAKGETLEANEFIKDANSALTYQFVDETSINSLLNGEAGTYTVKIRVTSKNNKSIEVDATLVIMQYAIKGYLVCSTNEQNIENSNASMTVSEKFAIVNDGNNGYGKIAEEIHTFKFTDETEYSNLLATYKTENKITINNITGSTTFDDTTLTITIANEKENDKVVSEYGEVNLQNYSTIKTHFEKTLGYKCVYEN